jgi:hypothetical protein
VKKHKITKALLIKALKKAVANKLAVQEYLRGNVTLESLTKKGIVFGKPL